MLKEVSIEIIRKCPNKCLHCSSLSDENCVEILDYDRFVAVVQDAYKLGVKTICLSGGEPFLHRRIADMIGFVASLGLQAYVYTSGIMLHENNERASISKSILKKISSKVTKLIFNIEAAVQSTYDEIMGTTDCFEKMKQSVRDAHSFNITTEAHFVPMKLNVGEVRAVVELCKELNVSKLSFLRLVLHGRAQANKSRITLSDDELEKFKAELEALKKQSDLDIRIGVPLSTDALFHKCEAANGKLNIKYDGNVFPCEVFKNERMAQVLNDLETANIYGSTLLDIYSNSEYLKAIRLLSEKYTCGRNCETCLGQYLLANGGKSDGE
ncbi:MAG: radical SAM protein [Ruminiclostridium sp.]|nr:radical SAM protein [Ruminiclostridium sp.]